jgi:N-acetyl-anhydromuramyl-L-alanine amidase AmpD
MGDKIMDTSIVVCGERFDIGTKVVLWDDKGGLNAYDRSKFTWKTTSRKTGKEKTRVVKGARFSKRGRALPNISKLKTMVTQFFLHHSGLYRSKTTFSVLHKERGLSCHFILDDNGTIFQTLDLREKAWHGGVCNPMSIGIEIDSRASAGKYPNAYNSKAQKKYGVGPRKKRKDKIHSQKLLGYEYNDAQYAALIKLTLGLVKIFPIIRDNLSFPEKDSKVVKGKISNPTKHKGLICHFHASRNKIDPISFNFERFYVGIGKLRLVTWKQKQEALIRLGYNPGKLDGIYGKKTEKAIKMFQFSHLLIPDGVWGPKTEVKIIERLGKL